MTDAQDNNAYKELATFETPQTLAFEHALDLSIAICEAMEARGISQKRLAEIMGVSPARMSQLLNLQPNLTLKTLAKFELALGIQFFKDIRTRKKSDLPVCLDLGDAAKCPVSSDWDLSSDTRKGVEHGCVLKI